MTHSVYSDIINLRKQLPLALTKVVILIGCYPSRDDPLYQHEYPQKLLQYLGESCLVVLIDPMYKSYPTKLNTGTSIDGSTHIIGRNVFRIYPTVVEECDIRNIDFLYETFVYDFSGHPNLFGLLQQSNLDFEYLNRYNFVFNFNPEVSSCMLSVEDPVLFPVKTPTGFYNKASAIMKYVTEGITPESTTTVPELNRFFYTLFQEYSSMLRKEYMYLNGQRDFYNASEYKSILESEDNIVQNTFNKKQNCFSWILGNMKQETLIEKFSVLMMRYLYMEGAHVKEEFHQDYESIFRCSSDTEKLRVLKNLYSSVASHMSLHRG
jgi:hypothetical protein